MTAPYNPALAVVTREEWSRHADTCKGKLMFGYPIMLARGTCDCGELPWPPTWTKREVKT